MGFSPALHPHYIKLAAVCQWFRLIAAREQQMDLAFWIQSNPDIFSSPAYRIFVFLNLLVGIWLALLMRRPKW